MRYRTFGPSGLRVSQLWLGAMIFGDERGHGAPVDQCRPILDAYREAGGNVIDTASRYAGGASERIVGDLIAGDRDRWVVSTKYTMTHDGTDPNASGNHRMSLRRSLENSLRSLDTDRIDLLWVHIWDPRTPIEETMRTLDDVVRVGKVLYVGVSDMPAWVVARANTLAQLRGWSPFVGLQLPYSLVQREIERELLPMADGLGLGVCAWSTLAGGMLSGKVSRGTGDGTSRGERGGVSERDLAIARVVDEVADELGVSSSRVAVAWTTASRPDLHPIVGARHLDQLTDTLAAVDLVLPPDALARLEAASAIEPGFPYDFLVSTRGAVYGPVDDLVDR